MSDLKDPREIEKEEHRAVKSIRNNSWIAVSIVLGIAVIILLSIVLRGGIAENSISGDDAGKSLVQYLIYLSYLILQLFRKKNVVKSV